MRNGRRTIGLLVSGIMDNFTEALCRGAVEACHDNNVDLIVFPGKYLDRDLSTQKDIMYEYQFNTLFGYAKSEDIDGIIVSAGNIGCFAGDERVREMLEGYGDIPCVLVASKWDGYISINYDNKSGVQEGLEYLINDLHCERFALLGGPSGNTDAQERKEIFVEVLKKNGIKVTDQMMAYGSLNRDNPEECNMLLDDNPDVEAIFCVNDDMALGMYDVMRRRGLVPGKDIKVFGYDNTIAGAKANPSLSSVGADAAYLGQRAVFSMCKLLDGESVESEIIPARFIKRDSIGKNEVDYEINADMSDEEIDRIFNEIFYRYLNKEKTDGAKLRKTFCSLVNNMLQIFNDPLGEQETKKSLNKDMERFFEFEALDYADMEALLFRAERLFELVCNMQQDIEKKLVLKGYLETMYRKIIENMDYKVGCMRLERQDDINSMKIFVRDSLKFRKGNDATYTAMLECLEWLNIHNAYLYVFGEPIPHLYQEEFEYPEHIYLKAYLQNDSLNTVPVNGQKINIKNMFSNEYIGNERFNYVLLPLFYNEMQYGLLLCDLSEKLYENGEFLTNQLGASVHVIDMLRENEKIQQQLNEVVVSLRENNIELDNLSKRDALTEINNRRGFFDEAVVLIENNRSLHLDTLVAYVDMNNLKVINDRYGHEEGDYSLKLISRILSELVGESGIVGRIGGDEYAFAMTMDKNMDMDSLERRIHSMFSAHNRRSDKPYNVTVSVGFYQVDFDSMTGIEDALSFAAERLYVAKQNKVRTVEKG